MAQWLGNYTAKLHMLWVRKKLCFQLGMQKRLEQIKGPTINYPAYIC